jgi:hypothetical protein
MFIGATSEMLQCVYARARAVCMYVLFQVANRGTSTALTDGRWITDISGGLTVPQKVFF